MEIKDHERAIIVNSIRDELNKVPDFAKHQSLRERISIGFSKAKEIIEEEKDK